MCKFCDVAFRTKNRLEIHTFLEVQNQYIKEESIKCKNCIITCYNQQLLRKHMKREYVRQCNK